METNQTTPESLKKSRRSRFQFTLRQLLVATVWFSLAFAAIGLAAPQFNPHSQIPLPVLVFFCMFVVFASIGAGVGTLLRDPWKGASYGALATLVVFFLGPLVVPAIWFIRYLLISQ